MNKVHVVYSKEISSLLSLLVIMLEIDGKIFKGEGRATSFSNQKKIGNYIVYGFFFSRIGGLLC